MIGPSIRSLQSPMGRRMTESPNARAIGRVAPREIIRHEGIFSIQSTLYRFLSLSRDKPLPCFSERHIDTAAIPSNGKAQTQPEEHGRMLPVTLAMSIHACSSRTSTPYEIIIVNLPALSFLTGISQHGIPKDLRWIPCGVWHNKIPRHRSPIAPSYPLTT